YRDIASWLDWAFGLEPPAGFTGNTDSQRGSTPRPRRPRTPVPPNREEDEAVEIVWGAGAAESDVGPVVLEEVPDVSEKHRVKRDTGGEDGEVDDIPTPPPSHGTMPSIYGAAPPRPSSPTGPVTGPMPRLTPRPQRATGAQPVDAPQIRD